jgi:hypothetical protein
MPIFVTGKYPVFAGPARIAHNITNKPQKEV